MTIEYGSLPSPARIGRVSEAAPWHRELLVKLPASERLDESAVWARLPKRFFTRSAASSVARTVNQGRSVWTEGGPWRASVRREDNCWRVHVARIAADSQMVEVDPDIVRFQ